MRNCEMRLDVMSLGMLIAEGEGVWRRMHRMMAVWHPEDDFE